MELEKCVTCGIPVNTDNGFGHIPKDEVYCSEHMDIGRKLHHFHNVIQQISKLKKEKIKLENEIIELNCNAKGIEVDHTIKEFQFLGSILKFEQLPPGTLLPPTTRFEIITREQLSKIEFDQLGWSILDGHYVMVSIKVKVMNKTLLDLAKAEAKRIADEKNQVDIKK